MKLCSDNFFCLNLFTIQIVNLYSDCFNMWATKLHYRHEISDRRSGGRGATRKGVTTILRKKIPRLMTSMELYGRGLSERPPLKNIFLLIFIPILSFFKKIHWRFYYIDRKWKSISIDGFLSPTASGK